MKINFRTIKSAVLVVILVAVFVVAKVRAASDFPEILDGMTTVTLEDVRTVYAGMAGNYAVLNHSPSSDYGFRYDSSGLGLLRPGCLNQTFVNAAAPCFQLGTGQYGKENVLSVGDRLMTSRTLVDGTPVYELPALLFAGINISGDVAGDLNSYLLNFWDWANSDQNANSVGNAWKLNGYQFNPDAQATWTSAKFSQYMDKLTTLAGSGTAILSTIISSTPNIWLQSGSAIIDNNSDDAANYPDGKVWVINGTGTTTIGFDALYHGKGTIIINGGNLVVGPGVDIQPDPSTNSQLGIIVLGNGTTTGNCTFNGNNSVQAMVLCMGTFKTLGNETFKGSFVAKDFNITNDTTSSITFAYDPALDGNQPPGFGNLAMPGSTEVGNR